MLFNNADAALQVDAEQEVDGYLRRKYTTAIRDIETVSREDLDLKNHLSGLQRKLLKVGPAQQNTKQFGQTAWLP